MISLIIIVLALTAFLFGSVAYRLIRRESERAADRPYLTASDGPMALAILFCTLASGGVFGFTLALVLDRYLGVWGILVAAAVCAALFAGFLLRPGAAEERA